MIGGPVQVVGTEADGAEVGIWSLLLCMEYYAVPVLYGVPILFENTAWLA